MVLEFISLVHCLDQSNDSEYIGLLYHWVPLQLKHIILLSLFNPTLTPSTHDFGTNKKGGHEFAIFILAYITYTNTK